MFGKSRCCYTNTKKTTSDCFSYRPFKQALLWILFLFLFNSYKLSGTSYKRCYATGWVGNAKCQSKSLWVYVPKTWLLPDATMGPCFMKKKDQWEDFHVMCLLGSSVVTCDKPGQVTNGRSLWSSGDPPKYGEAVQYLCNQGYTLVGKEKVVCTETGRYDSQPPQCQGQPGSINIWVFQSV